MNKNKYFDRYQNLNLSKDTLDRMWLTYLREQEEMQHRIYVAQLVPMGGTAQESALSVPTVVTVDLDPSGFTPFATAYGNVTSAGGAEITERGFILSVDPDANFDAWDKDVNESTATGEYNQTVSSNFFDELVYVRAYATNSVGTGYGEPLTYTPSICLVAGTMVTLADWTTKPIEEITYDDVLLAWNFDEGKYDVARPLWIKATEQIANYNLLTFSNGTKLGTVGQHRIFNEQAGAFTWPMTDSTPISTSTFTLSGRTELVGKEVVAGVVEYYNVITDYHINLFANGVLTSCRYNNIYPIVDMRFVKDERTLRPREEFNIPDKYFSGLRVAEQIIDADDVERYVGRLVRKEVVLV